jgi:hypothetical protein
LEVSVPVIHQKMVGFWLWKAESKYFYAYIQVNICFNFIAHDYLGFSKHFGRRGPIHGVKDVDGYSISSEGKHPRKSSTSAYGSNEVPKFDFCIVTLHILFWFNK